MTNKTFRIDPFFTVGSFSEQKTKNSRSISSVNNSQMLYHRLFSSRNSFFKSRSRFFSHYDHHDSPTVPHHIDLSPSLNLSETLPTKCQILIAGGGILGQSIAFHLTELGVKDVVLVEKAKLVESSISRLSLSSMLFCQISVWFHMAKFGTSFTFTKYID